VRGPGRPEHATTVQLVLRGAFILGETILECTPDECIADVKARVSKELALPVTRLRLLAEQTEQILSDALYVSQCRSMIVEGRIIITLLLADRDLYVEHRVYLPSVLRYGTTIPEHFREFVTEENWERLWGPPRNFASLLTWYPVFAEFILRWLCLLPKCLLYIPVRCIFGESGVAKLVDNLDIEFDTHRDALFWRLSRPFGVYLVQKYHKHFAKRCMQGQFRFLPARGRSAVSKLYIRLRFYTRPCGTAPWASVTPIGKHVEFMEPDSPAVV